MTLLDFVKQFVRVHNIDEDWYYYETGDYPELFEKNWNNRLKWMNPEDIEYYTKKDFNTVEEGLDDEPDDLIQMLIDIAWATNQDIDFDKAEEDDDWGDMYKGYCTYEICIGSDYETEVEACIDLT